MRTPNLQPRQNLWVTWGTYNLWLAFEVGSSLMECSCMLSHVQLFVTLWTVAHQALLFMGLSRQEHWSGLSFPPPEGSSQPSDGPQVSCVSCKGRRILYHYATWEVQPLTCRKWCYLQVDSVRIGLNCRTASWCCRIIWCGERTHTHLGTSLVVQAGVQLVWSLIR